MALPELVVPVLTAGGPIALVLVVLRFGPDAFLRLLAGTVAVLTHDKERGERCLKVLRISYVTRTISRSPLPNCRAIAERQPKILGGVPSCLPL